MSSAPKKGSGASMENAETVLGERKACRRGRSAAVSRGAEVATRCGSPSAQAGRPGCEWSAPGSPSGSAAAACGGPILVPSALRVRRDKAARLLLAGSLRAVTTGRRRAPGAVLGPEGGGEPDASTPLWACVVGPFRVQSVRGGPSLSLSVLQLPCCKTLPQSDDRQLLPHRPLFTIV